MFRQRRDLFTTLDIVFFYITAIHFEGKGGETFREYGKSKDHRSDRKQMVAGLVLDNDGYPVCSEMWLGNASDHPRRQGIAAGTLFFVEPDTLVLQPVAYSLFLRRPLLLLDFKPTKIT